VSTSAIILQEKEPMLGRDGQAKGGNSSIHPKLKLRKRRQESASANGGWEGDKMDI
jgi:hypothetical protein